MRVAVEVEFPDDRAAAAFQWLQSLPEDFVVHFTGRQQRGQATDPAADEALTGERERRFLALFGVWQSEETGDELNRMLRESRHFNRPDVDL